MTLEHLDLSPSSPDTPPDAPSEWDSLTESAPDTPESSASWDDLASVGFTGDSSPEATASPENAAEVLPDTTRIGTVDLPTSALNPGAVVINTVQPRSKYDFIGRRRDQKALSRLLEFDSESSEQSLDDAIESSFTPSVAGAFIEALHSLQLPGHDIPVSNIDTLFESLPLETQAQLLASESIYDLMYHLDRASNDSFFPGSLPNPMSRKLAAGLISRFESPSLTDRDRYVAADLTTCSPDSPFAPAKRGYFDRLSPELSQRLFESLASASGNSYNAGLLTLSSSRFVDNLGTLLPDSDSADSLSLLQLFYTENLFGRGTVLRPDAPLGSRIRPEAIQLMQTLGDKVIGGSDNPTILARNHAYCTVMDALKVKDVAEITERFEATRELRTSLGISAGDWLVGLAASPELFAELSSADSLDDKTAERLRRYLHNGAEFRFHYGAVSSLAELSHLEDKIIAEARRCFEDGMWLDARDRLANLSFGTTPGTIGRDLVALGLIEVSGDTRRRTEINDPETFFDSNYDSAHTQALPEGLARLSRDTSLSADEKLLLLDAINFLTSSKKALRARLSAYEQGADATWSGELSSILEKLRAQAIYEVNQNYSQAIQSSLEASSTSLEPIQFEGVDLPVQQITGEEFYLLVHRVGAYFHKDLARPEQWNEGTGHHFDADGRPLGYISTSLIGDGSIHLAADPGQENAGSCIFYGFSDLSDHSIQFMAEYDTYTSVDTDLPATYTHEEDSSPREATTTDRQERFYSSPRELLDRTDRKVGTDYGYNEVVLDRYAGDPAQFDGRTQPNYIVVFASSPAEISDLAKAHAKYFQVPLLLIDPVKYRKRKGGK